MADRFPSLDDFDAGQTEARPDTGINTDESNFLDRERALLGDDAAQFASANDNLATVEDGDDDDLLGGGGNAGAGGEELDLTGDMGGFESSFPDLGAGEHMAPGGTITGDGLPYLPGAPQTTSSYAPRSDSPEPDVIREWRERRDLAIQHRDEVSANRKAETIKAAQQAIDDFYENYNNKREKGISQTQREAEEFLASRDDTTAGGTSWERIAKLVDVSGKGTRGGASGSGKERFRELLVSLRKDQKAPGAEGY